MSKAMLFPANTPPQRIPTFPNVERTAVLPFRTTTTFSVPYTGSGTTAIASDGGLTDSYLVLFSQPASPLWGNAVVDSTGMEYLIYVSASAPGTAVGTSLTPGNVFPQTAAAMSSLPYSLTAYSFPIGVLASEPFLFKPAFTFGDGAAGKGCRAFIRISVTGATGTPTGTIAATIRWWLRGGETLTEYVTLSGTANGTFTGYSSAAATNHLSFFKVDALVVATTVSYAGTPTAYTVTSGWVCTSGTPDYLVPAGKFNVLVPLISSPPQISASKLPWIDTRSTACALLASNTTKVINKEGTINCARVSLNTGRLSCAAFAPSSSEIAAIHPSLRYFGPMEKGAYTFLPPSQEMQQFFDCTYMLTLTGSSQNYAPAFNLDTLEHANVLAFSDPDASTISNLALTLDQHIEFRTTTTIFEVAICSSSLDEFQRASAAVARITPFTENPLHVPAVLGALNAMLPVVNAGYELWRNRSQAARYIPRALPPPPQPHPAKSTRSRRSRRKPPPQLPPRVRTAVNTVIKQRMAGLNRAMQQAKQSSNGKRSYKGIKF